MVALRAQHTATWENTCIDTNMLQIQKTATSGWHFMSCKNSQCYRSASRTQSMTDPATDLYVFAIIYESCDIDIDAWNKMCPTFCVPGNICIVFCSCCRCLVKLYSEFPMHLCLSMWILWPQCIELCEKLWLIHLTYTIDHRLIRVEWTSFPGCIWNIIVVFYRVWSIYKELNLQRRNLWLNIGEIWQMMQNHKEEIPTTQIVPPFCLHSSGKEKHHGKTLL